MTEEKEQIIDLSETPSLPEGLKSASEDNRLVVFIGAGISRLVGCEGWDSLADSLISTCFDYGEAEQIKNATLSSKEKITIAYHQSKTKRANKKFWTRFKKALLIGKSKNKLDLRIYESLSKLNTLYITTNADGLMEHLIPAWSTKCSSTNLENAKPPFLFYLHGRYGDGTEREKSSLVFTVDSYLEAYADPNRLEFLKTVFRTKTVLFVGYGMSEFEVLDHLFVKTEQGRPKEIRHYILEGFCSYELSLCKAKEQYYQSLGIGLIPFNKDRNGFNQQISVIERWVDDLTITSTYNATVIMDIHSRIPTFTEDDFQYIKYYVSLGNQTVQTYLSVALNEISKFPSCYDWLHSLWAANVISSDDFPPIITVSSNSYQTQRWDFLVCLKNCLENYPSDKLLTFSSDILPSIIQKAYSSDDYWRNSWAVRELGNVMVLLPEQNVKVDFVEFIERWRKGYPFDAISVLYDQTEQWLEWAEKHVNRILLCLFAPFENNYSNDSHWLGHARSVLVPKLKLNQCRFLLGVCASNLQRVDHTDYFDDFETRFTGDSTDYPDIIVQTITDILDRMEPCEKGSVITDWIKTADTSLQIQMSLHFAQKYRLDLNFLLHFALNPLQFRNTLTDLYCYIDDFLSRECILSDSVIKCLKNWISSANFGLDDRPMDDLRRDRINARKLQLYELLKEVDPEVESRYADLEKTVENKIQRHPKETAKLKVPTVTTITYEKVFFENELNTLTPEEMLLLAKQKISAPIEQLHYFGAVEVYVELFEKVAMLDKLDALFALISQLDIQTLDSVTLALSRIELADIIARESIFGTIGKIAERLCSEPESDDWSRCVRNMVYILKALQEKKWKSAELLELCISLDDSKLWRDHKVVPSLGDDDVFHRLINDSKGQFIILMIQCACKTKRDSDLIDQFFQYLENRLGNLPSEWLLLALAFQIQNLYYLNEEWASTKIRSIITAVPTLEPHMITIICNSTSYIIPEITDIMFENGRIYQVLSELSGPSNTNKQDYRNGLINYLTSAFFFGHITEDYYVIFVIALQTDDYDALFKCIVLTKNGELIHTIVDVVYLVYDLLKKDHSLSNFAYEVFHIVDKLETISQRTWNMMKECIESMEPNRVLSWYKIDMIFDKNELEYFPEVTQVIIIAIEKFRSPSLELIVRILDWLLEKGKKEDKNIICNKMIQFGYFVDEMSDYLVK